MLPIIEWSDLLSIQGASLVATISPVTEDFLSPANDTNPRHTVSDHS